MTVKQAAEYLSLHSETVRDKARLRLMPGMKLGGQWRFWKSSIDEWLAQGCPSRDEQPTLFDNWRADGRGS